MEASTSPQSRFRADACQRCGTFCDPAALDRGLCSGCAQRRVEREAALARARTQARFAAGALLAFVVATTPLLKNMPSFLMVVSLPVLLCSMALVRRRSAFAGWLALVIVVVVALPPLMLVVILGTVTGWKSILLLTYLCFPAAAGFFLARMRRLNRQARAE